MLKKKILLIGGYGFLGSNILRWVDDNVNDIEFSVLSSIRSLTNHEKFRCVKDEFFGDFGDELFLKSAFLNAEYNYVFHCLTSTTPANSNSSVVKDIESNLINTIKLLEIIKKTKATVVFFSSGGAIYSSSNSTAHTEEDMPNPISSYGIVKNTIEQYIKMFHKLYGLNYLNLRISNPYGFFHKSNIQGLINVAVRKSIKKEAIDIWGDGKNVKDYIFAQDIPPVIFSLLEKKINTTVNIGSGEGTSINTLLGLIRELEPDLHVNYKESKLHDVKDFILNVDSVKQYMKLTSLREGLKKTYDWQKENIK